jgi:hypothetical protein
MPPLQKPQNKEGTLDIQQLIVKKPKNAVYMPIRRMLPRL